MRSDQTTRGLHEVPAKQRLNSWKDVPTYLGISVRTAQRWKETEGLPVHRHVHTKGGTIYAYSQEINEWLAGRRSRTAGSPAHSDLWPEERRKAGPAKVTREAPRHLIVLPFRLVQPDPEIEYLPFALADAVAASLSGLHSLSVRSSLVAVKYAGETDLKRIASETAVDVVLSGTLLRSGEKLRVGVQLVETATGTILLSQTMQAGVSDVFQLQDQVIASILSALAVSLNAEEQRRLREDVPRSPAAYDHYLRANELAQDFYPAACGLYLSCLEEDPYYAPGWARLGRCFRITAKFGGDREDFSRAQRAFARALELNPNLALAHNQLAYLLADCNLAEDAMVRLLDRAKTSSADPELFASLVHVCRFCGLLEASVAAHGRAHQLDPPVRTSICHTFLLLGEYYRALDMSREVLGYIGPLALLLVGRRQEAVALARRTEETSVPLPYVRCVFSAARALAEERRAEAIELTERAATLITTGPEELFQLARHFAYLRECERALAILRRAVEEGFFCYPALLRDPWLNSVRSQPRFEATLKTALERHTHAVRAFVEAAGERILCTVPRPRAT